ncbi:hypothetical protein HS1genome_1850 [Sulfodiicoccus acidiphilus]|uniref:ATPase AAA-type core domain-containing protein n=1 Tax=Sulfodiicoccus acidiphilus TaxID=1670455 RepID=A0A348B5K9_9CREN|nr:ATP/GTP-binding protein [Sulfodiicoccus acidiphilus]BBD73461.1 hypothetical protein HS1genome_1850 [Sulfodiicoccus acidiphilus]GGT92943.1 hypothetical protein GCM10007116_08460 [Sulfodiicoccus acidiphilus]
MIKRVRLKNFKSFDDVTVELRKINVFTGPNGAGKSNLVDAFVFLKEFLRPGSFPPYPFIRWGGYSNLVFMKDENANVELEIEAEDYSYRLVVNGKDGLRVLEESLKYKETEVKRKYNEVEIEGKILNLDPSMSVFHSVQRLGPMVLSNIPLPLHLTDFMSKFGNDIAVLRLEHTALLRPVPFNFPNVLGVDGFGLPKVLSSQPPKPVLDFLSEFNLSLKVDVSPEGNFVLNLVERVNGGTLVLHPSSIPSGVVKMLAILTAIYVLRPSILLIDEVENSLHLNFLERLVDIFDYSEPQVVLTTHSPAVIDLVDPADVVTIHKEGGRSVLQRVKDTTKLKEWLREKGLLLSEYLYYS